MGPRVAIRRLTLTFIAMAIKSGTWMSKDEARQRFRQIGEDFGFSERDIVWMNLAYARAKRNLAAGKKGPLEVTTERS